MAEKSQSNYEAYLKRVESRLSSKIDLGRISKDHSQERSTSRLACSLEHGITARHSDMLTRSAIVPSKTGPLHSF
jgi:hypothetical protein